MKNLSTFQSKINNKITFSIAAMTIFFMDNPVFAQKQNLEKAKTAIESLQIELGKIVPTLAAVILLCLAIGYAGRFIERDTFLRWSVGVILAGSAAEISKMFFANPTA
ncbi:VirB2 family type IV secretion system major pilin TrwL [Bartonella sp. CB189]|uniref:VirB2 family type IV secretion system major pilin TrwL n=1 Tax=Bartonella sp. CB189 TaxID=3112254 RepID=UPI002F961EED